MKLGQITRNSILGNSLYLLSMRPEIRHIVEMGTWNGMGSTKCIIDGLSNRSDNYRFVSVELYPDMYLEARNNLQDYLNDKIVLLQGKIVEYEDTFWFDRKTIDPLDEHAKLYLESDMKYLKTEKNVFDQVPKSIDLCVLDGGEYSTYPEYLKLKDRVKIFALDDTRILKCSKIREELMQEKWGIILDDLNVRNGVSILKRPS